MCVDGETVDGDGEDDVRKMEESEEKMKKVEEKVWWGGENQKGGERVRKQRCLLWSIFFSLNNTNLKRK